MPWANPEVRRKYAREWARKNKEKVNANSRWQQQRVKLEVQAAYGGYCNCCGETETVFLALDHIDGKRPDGVEYMSGAKLWRWLKKNDYPEGFQVLCHNCNFAVARGRVCPHQMED